jgi:hypothetical protein
MRGGNFTKKIPLSYPFRLLGLKGYDYGKNFG